MKFDAAKIRRLADDQRQMKLTAGVAVADALVACLDEIERLTKLCKTTEMDVPLETARCRSRGESL